MRSWTNPDIRSFRGEHYLHFIVLAAILVAVLCAYSNVFHGELQFDDEVFINESLGHLGLASFFSSTTILNALHGNRMLTLYSFAANYHFGGLSVTGYHIVNIVIHVCTTLLVFYFTKLLFVLAPRSEFPERTTVLFSLCVTAFFALHPLQTESVSYIVQRSELLASFWYLACLISLLRFTVTVRRSAFAWWCAGATFFIAGWSSKEIIITVPLVYLLCIIYTGGTKYLAKAWKGLVPYCVTGSVLIGIKLVTLNGSTDAGFSSFTPGVGVYVMTQLKVIAIYLLMVLAPRNQNIDHDVRSVTTLLSLEGALLVIAWMCVLFVCFYLLAFYKGVYAGHIRGMAFGLLWIIVILLPTSSVIPVRDVMFEHRMYLPLLGAGIVLVLFVNLMMLSLFPGGVESVLWALLLLVSVSLGYATFQRNMVWQSKLSLWADSAKKSPNKSRPHNNMGNCYLLSENYRAAIVAYRTAIRLDPSNIEAYYNLSLALRSLGQVEEALKVHRMFVDRVGQKTPDNK